MTGFWSVSHPPFTRLPFTPRLAVLGPDGVNPHRFAAAHETPGRRMCQPGGPSVCLHPPERPVSSQNAGLIGLDRFVLTQHPTATLHRFEIRAVTDDGGDGPVLAAAQRHRQAYRDRVTFFADETRSHPVFSFKPRAEPDAGEAFDVFDAGGRPIGRFRKESARTAQRPRWLVETDAVRATAEEPNAGLLRRLPGVAPRRPASLDFVDADGRQVMASERRRGAVDRCVVTVPDGRLDSRVAAAMAVALEALQVR